MSTYIVNPTEEQEKAVKAFFEALEVVFFKDDDELQEELPAHVLEGIRRGQEDIKAERTITSEEFKKELSRQIK